MVGSAPRGTLELLCQCSRCWSSCCLSQESLQWRHVWRHCLAETLPVGLQPPGRSAQVLQNIPRGPWALYFPPGHCSGWIPPVDIAQ